MCWELIDVAEKAKVKQWLETEATAMKKNTQRRYTEKNLVDVILVDCPLVLKWVLNTFLPQDMQCQIEGGVLSKVCGEKLA